MNVQNSKEFLVHSENLKQLSSLHSYTPKATRRSSEGAEKILKIRISPGNTGENVGWVKQRKRKKAQKSHNVGWQVWTSKWYPRSFKLLSSTASAPLSYPANPHCSTLSPASVTQAREQIMFSQSMCPRCWTYTYQWDSPHPTPCSQLWSSLQPHPGMPGTPQPESFLKSPCSSSNTPSPSSYIFTCFTQFFHMVCVMFNCVNLSKRSSTKSAQHFHTYGMEGPLWGGLLPGWYKGEMKKDRSASVSSEGLLHFGQNLLASNADSSASSADPLAFLGRPSVYILQPPSIADPSASW